MVEEEGWVGRTGEREGDVAAWAGESKGREVVGA